MDFMNPERYKVGDETFAEDLEPLVSGKNAIHPPTCDNASIKTKRQWHADTHTQQTHRETDARKHTHTHTHTHAHTHTHTHTHNHIHWADHYSKQGRGFGYLCHCQRRPHARKQPSLDPQQRVGSMKLQCRSVCPSRTLAVHTAAHQLFLPV